MQNSNAVVKKIYCIVINGKIFEIPPRKHDCYS